MSIQRWSVARSELCPVGEEAIEIVTYADHVAAVAEAEQRGYDRALGDEPVESDPLYLRGRNDGYDAAMNEVPAIAVYGERLRSEGHAAGLDAAREAVAALPDWKFCDAVCGTDRSVVAAIDALRGES